MRRLPAVTVSADAEMVTQDSLLHVVKRDRLYFATVVMDHVSAGAGTGQLDTWKGKRMGGRGTKRVRLSNEQVLTCLGRYRPILGQQGAPVQPLPRAKKRWILRAALRGSHIWPHMERMTT